MARDIFFMFIYPLMRSSNDHLIGKLDEDRVMIKTAAEAFSQVGIHFEFAPFKKIIQPIIDDVLKEHQKDKSRKGTILTPCILVWLCFSLALRRNSNYSKTLNWLLAGFRWKSLDFNKK